MKTVLAIVLVIFLSSSYASPAQDSTGSIGYKTIQFWYGLPRDSQLYYLMGALDVLIVSCPSDIATVGAMENVLRNRIRDGLVRLTDLVYVAINKIVHDFGCTSVIPTS